MFMCYSYIRLIYEANPAVVPHLPARFSCISQFSVPKRSLSLSKESTPLDVFSSKQSLSKFLAFARCFLRQLTIRLQASLNLIKLLSGLTAVLSSIGLMRSGCDSRAHLRYCRRSSRSEQSSSRRSNLQQLLISSILAGGLFVEFQLSIHKRHFNVCSEKVPERSVQNIMARSFFGRAGNKREGGCRYGRNVIRLAKRLTNTTLGYPPVHKIRMIRSDICQGVSPRPDPSSRR